MTLLILGLAGAVIGLKLEIRSLRRRLNAIENATIRSSGTTAK